MSDRTPFDDLARRKLEERAFPFDEAAWHAMQQQLPQRKDRRRLWIGSGLLLLLIGAFVWWNASSTPEQNGIARPSATPNATPEGQAAITAPVEQQATIAPANNASVAPEAQRVGHANAAVAAAVTHPSAARSGHAAPARANAQATASAERPTRRHIDRTHAAGSARRAGAIAVNNIPVHKEAQPAYSADVRVPNAASPAATIPSLPATPMAIDGTAANNGTNTSDGSPAGVVDPDAMNTATGTDDRAANNSADARPAQAAPAITITGPTTENTSSTSADPPVTTSSTDHDATATVPTQHTAPPDSLPQDTTAQVTPHPQDSTTAAAPITLPTVPDPGARWEVSVLGGAFLTNTHYSGERADAWQSDVAARPSTGFGAEFMHMGAHFGLGIGVHYNTYAERISAHELSTTTSGVRDSNYFVAVDTTVLRITGIVHQGDHDYYVVEALDTVLHVLVLDTVSYTELLRRRAALERINTVSYIEVPLLADVHTTFGRWSGGVRGGPYFGVLEGRRGLLPNALLDGYAQIQDESFRELVFGLTARLYIRYRLFGNWSVGVEPTWRMQLLNGMQGSGLSRSTSAVGGLLSVSYRFP